MNRSSGVPSDSRATLKPRHQAPLPLEYRSKASHYLLGEKAKPQPLNDHPLESPTTRNRLYKRENASELPPMLPVRGPRPIRLPKTLQQIDSVYQKHSGIHSQSPAMRLRPDRADSF